MAGKTDFGKITNVLEKNKEKKSYDNKPKPNWMKIVFGDNTFSVLPPKDDDSELYEELYIHYKIVDHEGEERAFQCSKKKHGRCPVCDRAKALKDAKKEKEASEIAGKHIFLYNVRDLEGKNRVAQLKKTMHDVVLLELQNSYR